MDLEVLEQTDDLMEMDEVDIHLARANLLRMRGEYDPAREVCRTILKSFPHQAFAHAMLGDIALERSELDSAVSWFELACEYDPGYDPFVQKLAHARKRKGEHEAAEAARKLGFGAKGWSIQSLMAIISMVLVALAVAAFALGRQTNSQAFKPVDVTEPVIISDQKSLPKDVPLATSKATELNVKIETFEESLIVKAIQEKLQWNRKLAGVAYDPTEKMVILSYLGETDEQAQTKTDALLAEVTKVLPDVNTVLLRYFVDGRLLASARNSASEPGKITPSNPATIKESNDSDTKANEEPPVANETSTP